MKRKTALPTLLSAGLTVNEGHVHTNERNSIRSKVNLAVVFDAVNAMSLNEFLKEHRRMKEQDKGIEELTAQLKQQAAQIQKVSAQLELSKVGPQTVKNTD